MDAQQQDSSLILTGLLSQDKDAQLNILTQIHEQIYRDTTFIAKVASSGIASEISQIISSDCPPDLISASLRVLSWLAENSEILPDIAKSGGIPALVSLLSSNAEFSEQSVYLLGRIAAQSQQLRDQILENKIIEPLTKLLKRIRNTSLLTNSIATAKSIIETNPVPDLPTILPILDSLCHLVRSRRELTQEVISDVCSVISTLLESDLGTIQMVIDRDIGRDLVRIFSGASRNVQKPIMCIFDSITSSDDIRTQYLVDCGVVGCLREGLISRDKRLALSACKTVANLTSGTIDQIQCILDADLVSELVKIEKDGVGPIKIQAFLAIAYAIFSSIPKQTERFVGTDLIDMMFRYLDATDEHVISSALDGI
eukprot:TRINITY_DN10789_c0_g1_i1.p1 TRINITY_DN10789_c0_g1~~TRINITY_DN10789_c0_g1_i1.p1  ORF type:complete len:370 (-),score=61.82 TRINITY_DN10789_c0_g1_i1:134-1243(-)